MSKTQNDLNLSMGENERLSEELTRYRHFLNIFNFTNSFPPNFLIIYFKNSRILCPSRQQALYTELKKMRGRGEEMDMLQELEQVKNRLYDRMGCPKFLLYIYIFFFWQFRIQERLKSTSYLWNTNLEINLCKLSPWRKKKFDYWEKWPNWKLPETEM